MSVLVQLDAPFEIPPKCCRCLSEASEIFVAEHSSFVPAVLISSVQVTHSEFAGIPLCAKHVNVMKVCKRLAKAAMIGSLICCGIFGYLAEKSDKDPLYAYATLSFLGLAIVAGFSERWLMPVRLKQATPGPTGLPELQSLILDCSNPAYANLLYQANSPRATILRSYVKAARWLGLYSGLAPIIMGVIISHREEPTQQPMPLLVLIWCVMLTSLGCGLYVRYRCFSVKNLPGRNLSLVGIFLSGGFILAKSLQAALELI